ncbi:hypothetical protein GALL_68860 [mine drainage metagenome]|uniref:Uncharacterized protein n=1 Tax=mine drainage metagenome TaxID=410659 RepID=A0A1J5SS95_9ZZZZ
MNKEEITRIIENTLKNGDKIPGLFDLPRIMSIKAEIQACTSINDVLGLIEEHRDLIARAFGLSEDAIDQTVAKIKAIEG